MGKIRDIVTLLRINQWIKNVFIFFPIFFALRITDTGLLIKDLFTFIGFSFIASSVYIFNDLSDIESDKLHPQKKDRPLTSGKIGKKTAGVLIIILLLLASMVFWLKVNQTLAWILSGFYLILNILYSVKLKHVAIIDIVIIATGFLIRVVLGGVVTGTPLSEWIILITFLLALFLALAKRRDDVLIFVRTGNKMRKNIDGYNLDFLNVSISIMSAIVIVSYIMYATSPVVVSRMGHNIYTTSFFVIIGMLRYLQLTFVKEGSGSPVSILTKDVFLQLTICGWLFTFFILLYMQS